MSEHNSNTSLTALQVCYAIATEGWDCVAQMAYISANAVHLVHPDACRILVLDEISWNHVQRQGSQLAKVFDKVVPVATGLSDQRMRSRFLKTTIRQRVQGDFVFLDADTIPIHPFQEIVCNNVPFAAATDLEGDPDRTALPKIATEVFAKTQWRIPEGPYLNSGVMFFRDCDDAYRLCELWHKKWRESSKRGFHQDQPALHSAIGACGVEIGILPMKFNVMVNLTPWAVRGGSILHFFADGGSRTSGSLMQHLLAHLRDEGEVDFEAIQNCVREGHPWGPEHAPWQLWQSRNYLRAAWLKARVAARKLTGR